MAKTPPDYKKLKEIWYKKLEKSGFEDIEEDEYMLKQNSSNLARARYVNRYQPTLTYYRLAEHFLNDYTFPNQLEKTIWEYHSNGISARNIATTLKKVKVKTNYTTVWQTIRKLQQAMKAMYMISNTGSTYE